MVHYVALLHIFLCQLGFSSYSLLKAKQYIWSPCRNRITRKNHFIITSLNSWHSFCHELHIETRCSITNDEMKERCLSQVAPAHGHCQSSGELFSTFSNFNFVCFERKILNIRDKETEWKLFPFVIQNIRITIIFLGQGLRFPLTQQLPRKSFTLGL